jgi:hypothetical protein
MNARVAETRDSSGSVNTFPRQPTHVTAVKDMHGTIEELLEAVFFFGSMQRLYQYSLQAKEEFSISCYMCDMYT